MIINSFNIEYILDNNNGEDNYSFKMSFHLLEKTTGLETDLPLDVGLSLDGLNCLRDSINHFCNTAEKAIRIEIEHREKQNRE